MLRLILGVIAGFFVWSILWVAGDALVRVVWTSYDESVKAMSFSSALLVVPLILSIVCSVISGFVTALIAKESFLSTLILGVLLLLVGIFVQVSVWDKVQVWYHLAFLISLIPATILGGKLRKE